MALYRKLWFLLIGILIVTFSLLGYFGKEVYRQAPPIPDKFTVAGQSFSITKNDILAGQSAWQSVGGMELGSIWGHGSYQAPDWTADWLHRELTTWLDLAAHDKYSKPFSKLNDEQQAELRYRLKDEYRKNTYNSANGIVTLTPRRAEAIQQTAAYYEDLFGNDQASHKARVAFAMKENTLPNAADRKALADFFFWTAWAASTDRPNQQATYTNNWPYETLIDNVPTAENILWSAVSFAVLIAGIGGLIWAWAFLSKHDEKEPEAPREDPIAAITVTPSQRALGKYILLVAALFIFQVFIGGLTAHYTVEGQSFYGIDLSKWIPYSLSRTWHIQSAMFWIATGFLTAGLFLAPIINGGTDPKHQKCGVDILFCALIVVIVGSFIGNYLAIAHIMPEKWDFWLGHQGYEYVDLGRVWQIGKFAGIVFWLVLMLRAIVPALKKKGDRHLLALLTASTAAIGLFYGAGFFYSAHTNLAIMEYWRWWIVHLWVEGFFEVFAATALAFIFCTMGLVSRTMATATSLASASLFMLGGVPGTFHHLYFSGTTTPSMALGATFGALEVVPLAVLGYEAWGNWHLRNRAPWMAQLKWPLTFFVAVSFWNMLGAGVFGFLINPPIALYFIQGLNTTAVHAHAALFGVYGFLALGFCMLVLRYIRPDFMLNEKLMKTSFLWLNAGLVLMLATSLLPVGIIQFRAVLEHGYWYARSEGFMQEHVLETLRWVRTFGDVVFIVGALAWALQMAIGVLKLDRYAFFKPRT